MQLVRCSNGHYYDPSKHSSCPHCGVDIDLDIGSGGNQMNNINIPKTQAKRPQPFKNNIPKTTPKRPDSSLNVNGEHTVAKEDKAVREESKTKGVFFKKLGIDPVVGWLVCIEGADKGRDFRIRSGRNFIGRSHSMDICIEGDESISREKHAVIVFDPKKSVFIIQPGDSRELFYLNEEGVYTVMQLKECDIIELGQTKLMFIPFCGDKFKWD